jgi:hypothetical protein
MSANTSNNVSLCRKWCAAFDRHALDAVMALFTDDAVVVVGAGGSGSAIDYSGVFTGSDEIREYYEKRFATDDSPVGQLKPFCAMVPGDHAEIGQWVMFWGAIHRARYNGNFLHIWTVDATQDKLSRLEMYLDPSGRLSY